LPSSTVAAGPLLSKKTLLEFREHLVGWTLRTISEEFDTADVRCDLSYQPPVSGERRSLVEQYYYTLDVTKWTDVRKLLAVFENVLTKLHDDIRYGRYVGTRGQGELDKLTRSLRRDGFEWKGETLVAVGHVRRRQRQSLATPRMQATSSRSTTRSSRRRYWSWSR